MYVGDSLQRLNNEALERFGVENPDVECDYCSLPAVEHLPIYNPADAVRGVEGAYALISVCNEHLYERPWDEDDEAFDCVHCGDLFVTHHSWDYLAVSGYDGLSCQKCFIDNELESLPLHEVLERLARGETSYWVRLNDVPGHELIWSGSYGNWSDYPGHNSIKSLYNSIYAAAKEHDIALDAEVYVVVTFTGQFGVELAIYEA